MEIIHDTVNVQTTRETQHALRTDLRNAKTAVKILTFKVRKLNVQMIRLKKVVWAIVEVNQFDVIPDDHPYVERVSYLRNELAREKTELFRHRKLVQKIKTALKAA